MGGEKETGETGVDVDGKDGRVSMESNECCRRCNRSWREGEGGVESDFDVEVDEWRDTGRGECGKEVWAGLGRSWDII